MYLTIQDYIDKKNENNIYVKSSVCSFLAINIFFLIAGVTRSKNKIRAHVYYQGFLSYFYLFLLI
jgi:hypothetical protein